MKKYILAVVPFLAISAHAATKLPKIKLNQELCYVRVYTAAEIKADAGKVYEGNAQRVKGVALSLSKGAKANEPIFSKIYIRGIDGNNYTNGGTIVDVNGKTLTQLAGGLVYSQMDAADGLVKLKQSSANRDQVLIRSGTPVTYVSVDGNWESSEDTNLNHPLVIRTGDSDASMRVEWQHSNGTAKSCAEIFELSLQD